MSGEIPPNLTSRLAVLESDVAHMESTVERLERDQQNQNRKLERHEVSLAKLNAKAGLYAAFGSAVMVGLIELIFRNLGH